MKKFVFNLEIIFCFAIVFSFAAIIGSCKHDMPDVSQMRQICFTSEVLPIFQSNCALSGCHSSGSEFPLDSYSTISNAVEPGNPDNSEVYQAITSKWINAMPPDNPISQESRTLIRIWIEQGANNTNCAN